MNIFEGSFRKGKFDASRKLSDGTLMDFAKIYPMDAVFDTPEDVPEEVSRHLLQLWRMCWGVCLCSMLAVHPGCCV